MIGGMGDIMVGSVWWFIWMYVWCREVGEVVLWIRWFQVCVEMVGNLIFNGLVVIVQTFSQRRFLIAQRM